MKYAMLPGLGLAVLIAAAACSGEPRGRARSQPAPSGQPPPPAEFGAFACVPGIGGDTPRALDLHFQAKALAPALEIDYLAVRRAYFAGFETVASIIERGEPCARAAQPDRCRDALKRLEAGFSGAPETLCPGLECPGLIYVLTTQRDHAAAWRTPAELRQLLGRIDTPNEAWLMAQVAARAYPYLCGDAEFSAQRRVPGGFELRERRYTRNCHPIDLTEITYRVSEEGSVQTLDRHVFRSEPDGCVATGDGLRDVK